MASPSSLQRGQPLTDGGALALARSIANDVARVAAPEVDREARFPQESVDALREGRLLSALFPQSLGGLGCSVRTVAETCSVLSQACASTGMIFAMHQIQAACLVRHGRTGDFPQELLVEAAEQSWLLASATSEAGTHGDLGRSFAAVEASGETSTLHKMCPAISYGAYADAVLATARAHAEAAEGDQVLAVLRSRDVTLEPRGEWQPMGMRGTCSPPFELSAEFPTQQVMADKFRLIAAATMVPYSHMFWAWTWLGVATDAVNITRRLHQDSTLKSMASAELIAPGLASARAQLTTLRAIASQALEQCLTLHTQAPPKSPSMGEAISANEVKMQSSILARNVVLSCLDACGLRAYGDKAPFGLGRHVRDVLSAPLMISNERLNAVNQALLLIDQSVL